MMVVVAYDDCLDIVQQGTIAFGVGSIGLFYLSDQAKLVVRWVKHLVHHRSRGNDNYSDEDSSRASSASTSTSTGSSEAQTRKVVKVIVRSGALVDGVTFYYQGFPVGVNFGGNGGTEQAPFELHENEWIAEVRGRRGAYIDQVQFVTNTGRISSTYGGTGGEPFSFRLENGGPIGGLDVGVSINGWLRSIRGVIDVSKVNVSAPETPLYVREHGIVKAHRKRVRTRLKFIHVTIIIYTSFLMFAMSPFVSSILQSPSVLNPGDVTKEPTSAFVHIPPGVPIIADSDTFTDGQDIVRWVILNMNMESSSETNKAPAIGLLVKEVVEDGSKPKSSPNKNNNNKAVLNLAKRDTFPRVGIVRRLDYNNHGLVIDEKYINSPNFKWFWSGTRETISVEENDEPTPSSSSSSESGSKKKKVRIQNVYPIYYVDESFSPVLTYVCTVVVVCLYLYTVKTEWRQAMGYDDPVIRRFKANWEGPDENVDAETIAHEVDNEILEEGTLVLPWSSSLVAVTKNWLIKTNYLGLDAVAINDARLVDLRVSGRWIMGELVEIVTLRIESRRSVAQTGHHRGRATYSFDVALPRMQFESLQASFIDRVNARQEEQVKQREETYLERYFDMLKERAASGVSFPKPDQPTECLGACGEEAVVLIRKRCDTCDERNDCACVEPSWCHLCLLKWWLTKNRTRIELITTEDGIEPTWQTRCPTCRVYFCLNDVIPREDIADIIDKPQQQQQDEEQENPDEELAASSVEMIQQRRARAAAAAERRRLYNT